MTTTHLSLADLEQFDPYAPDRGRERRFCCPLPLCDGKPKDSAHRSLSVARDTGLWRCWRCGSSGRLKEWWEERPRQSRRARARAALRQAFSLAPAAPSIARCDLEWRQHLAGIRPLRGTPGEAYLDGRGIPVDLARAAGTRFAWDWFGRAAVVVPLRDNAGRLVAAQGRHVDDREPRMHSCGDVCFGVFSTPGAWEADRLILTEAPIDALTLAAAGRPAIALCGATNCPSWLPQACAFRHVLLALDGDNAGDAAAKHLAARLRPLGARVERLRPGWFKDWNALAPRLVEGLPDALAAVLG
jgi:hypothetical protein